MNRSHAMIVVGRGSMGMMGGVVVIGVGAMLALLPGCASQPTGSQGASAGAAASGTPEGVVHTVTEADLAATHSREPLRGDSAQLWVNGLGCPQCATNVDFQLKRIRGVEEVRTDLSTGMVSVSFFGKDRPSPQRLSEAMKDAGVTLVKIASE